MSWKRFWETGERDTKHADSGNVQRIATRKSLPEVEVIVQEIVERRNSAEIWAVRPDFVDRAGMQIVSYDIYEIKCRPNVSVEWWEPSNFHDAPWGNDLEHVGNRPWPSETFRPPTLTKADHYPPSPGGFFS